MRSYLLYACLPIIALIGLFRPFYGLLIYVLANIIRPEMLFWGGYTGAIIFRVSIWSTLIGLMLRKNEVLRPLSLREIWLMLWIVLAVFASLAVTHFTPNPRAMSYADEVLKLFILAWLILGLVYEPDRILKFENIVLGAASLLALWGCQQHFLGNVRLEGLGGSSFGDSNGVAAFSVLFFPLALHKLLTAHDRKNKLFGFVSALLLGLMTIFTESRGGLLGLIAAVLVLFWLTPKRKPMVIGLLVFAFVIFPFVGQQYINRMHTITAKEGERDFSAASRPVLWRVGLLIFKDNPIFGVGLLNYNRAKMAYKIDLMNSIDQELLDYVFVPAKVGHSTWICQLLAEGGLFLTIPYMWLVLGFFWGVRRVRKKYPPDQNTSNLHNLLCGLNAGIFGYCVCLVFIDGFLDIFLPMQVFIGMQLLRAIERKTRENSVLELKQVS